MEPNDLTARGLRVKALEFVDEDGDGILTARRPGRLYRIFPQEGGTFFAPQLPWEEAHSTSSGILIDRLNRQLEARILAAIEVMK